MFCTACGKSIPDNSQFCPVCGENLTGAPVNRSARQAEPTAHSQNQRTKRCANCACQIPADSRFCPECSADQRAAGAHTTAQRYHSRPEVQPLTPEQQAAQRKRNRILLACLGGVLGLCLIIGILATVIKPSINLNKYLTVSFDGYDSIGKATVTFDYDRFSEDYEEKFAAKLERELKKNKAKDLDSLLELMLSGGYDGYGYVSASRSFLDECVWGQLDRNSDLSNGDEVTYVWTCDDETALEEYGYKLKYSDITYTVEDLIIPEEFDPFAGLALQFSGIAPYGNVQFSGDLPAPRLSYEIEPRDGLSNGDTVTVTVSVPYSSEDLNKYCLRYYEALPSETSVEFTVSGLDSYICSASDISSDCMKEMEAKTKEVFDYYAVKDWGEGALHLGREYIGSYLVSHKEPSYWGSQNTLYMVYHVRVQNTFTNEDQTYDKVNEFYWFICFNDLISHPDGTTTVDTNNYSIVNNTFQIDSGIRRSSWSNKIWQYRGYQDLEDLRSQIYSVDQEIYSIEDNISGS